MRTWDAVVTVMDAMSLAQDSPLSSDARLRSELYELHSLVTELHRSCGEPGEQRIAARALALCRSARVRVVCAGYGSEIDTLLVLVERVLIRRAHPDATQRAIDESVPTEDT
jgi:hypothetical protein